MLPVKQFDLLGTAHISKASADEVRTLIASGDYDAVAVELCQSRYNSLTNPDSIEKMNLFDVIKSGKTGLMIVQLVLSAYQQRLAEQIGIQPGAEQLAAIEMAKAKGLPILLIDREIGITLKRMVDGISWWKRFGLAAGLLASFFSREEISEEEIEQLKQGDILETTFSEFAAERKELFDPLIVERDEFMAAKLIQEQEQNQYRHVLGIIGAGHRKGIGAHLQQGIIDPQARIDQLRTIQTGRSWFKILPWFIVALILTGFVIGFYRSPDLGWRLVAEWVFINGLLSALGAAIAGGHPLTLATAFIGAPITSLNPTIGAGMVTAAVETVLRKPKVIDFQRLRTDVTHWKGWWKNRASRILLVFLFSTLGSAAGTWIAGFRIFDSLF